MAQRAGDGVLVQTTWPFEYGHYDQTCGIERHNNNSVDKAKHWLVKVQRHEDLVRDEMSSIKLM